MGNSGQVKPSKSDKSSPPPAMEPNHMHIYPDWATMQAFYGPRFPVPPYMNSAVASPHAPPPYMWGPSPYVAPYAAFYAHGGVYAHPAVPLASATLGMETPAMSPGKTDGGFVKKLKELDGLAISIGNGIGNGDSTDPGTECRLSDSDETGGSSDGSNGVTPGAGQNGKKRSRQGSPNRGVGVASKKMIDVFPAANDTPVKRKENTNTGLEQKNSNPIPNNVPLKSVTNEAWVKNIDRELKREKRKQSNRESARRSRLRKHAESEELTVKVQALTSENINLKSELNELLESSELLKLENATLIEKLKPVGTVNLLARVNSNIPATTTEDGNTPENRGPRAKLRQLLTCR